MRQTPLMDFPVEEYQKRIQKFAAGLRKRGIDGALITDWKNTRYFSGLRSIVWESKISNPGMVIITANGDAGIVAYKSSKPTIQYSTFFEEDEIFIYGMGRIGGDNLPETFVDAILLALQKFGLCNKKIGMEMGECSRIHMNFLVMQELFSRLPDAKFVDCAQAIWDCRMIKSPAEQDFLRKATEINAVCFDAAFASVQLGKTTELDLLATMNQVAYDLGAESVPVYGILFGHDRFQGNCPPSSKVLTAEPHQILFIDGGPAYRGYCVDTIREAVTHSLTPRQAELFQVARDTNELALSQVKAGAPMARVSTIVNEYVDQYGFTEAYHTRGWIGHGIGLDFHELPQIEDTSERVFEPGMVITIEPSFMENDTMLIVEQNVIVTENGYELLSTSPTDMRILK